MSITDNIQYGHYIVRMAELTEPILGFGYSLNICSMSGKYAYGVFKINHARYSYDDKENNNPMKAFKLDLEPVSGPHFQRRDWYTSSVLSSWDIVEGHSKVFDNYDEALTFAQEQNKTSQK